MCVCVLLLLFPPPPTRSLELFNHVFLVGFTVSANRLGVTISAGFCWSTQCSSIESYSDVKIVPTVFSHPILAKKHVFSIMPSSFSMHVPSFYHSKFHWFSIDVPWFFHDFTFISPAFSICSIDVPWFHLHFPCIFHIFHGFLACGFWCTSAKDKAEFAYEAFNRGRDFGPLDLAATVRYCQWMDHLVPWMAGLESIGTGLSRDIYG